MRTGFVCASLEPGRDGVGDYTRRLAGELIRQGHPSVAVALNDTFVSEVVVESQEMEGAPVSVLRLPATATWSRRIAAARDWLGSVQPDWLSLQFVPFGFHRKGLCFGLGKTLAAMNTQAAWHVMFHELWLGLGENSSVKHRVYGVWQRRIVMDLVRRLQPRVVNTQTDSYRVVLQRDRISAAILPLFSNIPRVRGDGWNGLLEPLVAKAAGRSQGRDKLYLAGVLGMVAPEWSAEQAVNAIYPLTQQFQKRLVLVFYGRSDLNQAAAEKLKLSLNNRAEVVLAGERSSLEMSKILQTLDLGIATTPRQVIQKSGTVAAMLEHGLQILVTRDDWRLRGPDAPPAPESSRLLSLQQFAGLKTLPARSAQFSEESVLTRVAAQMLAAMKPPLPPPASLLGRVQTVKP